MNLITLKDRLLEMVFWAAVALDMAAALYLVQEMILKGRKLLKSKKETGYEEVD